MKKQGRPSLEEIYLRMAENLAERSTCARTKVGCVITTKNNEQVLGIGYNGNAKGFPNECDSAVPGSCGCIHAEANALIKSGSAIKDKLMYVTISPCVPCAKLIVNSGFYAVTYRTPYRLPDGVNVLKKAGILCKELKRKD